MNKTAIISENIWHCIIIIVINTQRRPCHIYFILNAIEEIQMDIKRWQHDRWDKHAFKSIMYGAEYSTSKWSYIILSFQCNSHCYFVNYYYRRHCCYKEWTKYIFCSIKWIYEIPYFVKTFVIVVLTTQKPYS
jgi:hypothetical protein